MEALLSHVARELSRLSSSSANSKGERSTQGVGRGRANADHEERSISTQQSTSGESSRDGGDDSDDALKAWRRRIETTLETRRVRRLRTSLCAPFSLSVSFFVSDDRVPRRSRVSLVEGQSRFIGVSDPLLKDREREARPGEEEAPSVSQAVLMAFGMLLSLSPSVTAVRLCTRGELTPVTEANRHDTFRRQRELRGKDDSSRENKKEEVERSPVGSSSRVVRIARIGAARECVHP